MAAPSIRRRLSRTVLALTLLGALLSTLAGWAIVRREVNELLDDTLQASADVLAELLGPAEQQPLRPGSAVTVRGPAADKHFAWQLVGADGRLLLRSSLAPPQPWLPRPTEGFSDPDPHWRVYGRWRGATMLYVAQTGEERDEAQLEVGMASAGTALLLSVLCALWLRRRVRQELLPLADLSLAIAAHDPLAEGATLPRPEREELLPIHDAIEELGRRLARRVANERAFSAHAAHALRTPLAGMDAQLAVALRESPPALRPRLLRTREATGRLRRVVTALLTLFRSGVDLRWQSLDVAALLARLPLEGLELSVRGEPRLAADPDLLAAALINLLDNSLRHGSRQVEIEVRHGSDGVVCIALRDDGRGETPERLQALQQALAAQHYEGQMGLGLMMADMVARAHGGRLALPGAERGFAVELWLGPPP
ncbi:sensor histidine kinase [Roseateles violae]|uniref:histidine kinase n=1 Tax=Roseateles violae TaxID=3058042 RepID=A0ABT8DMC8_9BURK|nr:ATP-binding protein [Pelomonas sp. PFR6]MDN3919088.1 ATP-binding protein [Pelomonas sp. PFR6]